MHVYRLFKFQPLLVLTLNCAKDGLAVAYRHRLKAKGRSGRPGFRLGLSQTLVLLLVISLGDPYPRLPPVSACVKLCLCTCAPVCPMSPTACHQLRTGLAINCPKVKDKTRQENKGKEPRARVCVPHRRLVGCGAFHHTMHHVKLALERNPVSLACALSPSTECLSLSDLFFQIRLNIISTVRRSVAVGDRKLTTSENTPSVSPQLATHLPQSAGRGVEGRSLSTLTD